MSHKTTNPASELTARVVRRRGGMSLEIDGEIQPFTSYKITETPDTDAMLEAARLEIPGLAAEGIRLCWVPVFIDWKGPGEYDFTDMDRRIATVLDLYDRNTEPGSTPARIVVRVQAAVFSPPWYIEKHADSEGKPTNLIEFRNPWGAIVDSCSADEAASQRFATQFGRYGSTFGISVGDAFWDTHAVDCLTAIVEHVRNSSYAHRVFGWLPCAFNTNEWFLRTFAPEASCDFSAPTQVAFREHLRAKGIACDAAPVPAPADCLVGDHGEFLDPNNPKSRLVEEFSLWLSARFADIIFGFAKAIKNAYADSPKLVGFFYGYILGMSRLQNLSQSAQLAVGRVMRSPDVDFICSPNEYFFRADEKAFTASTVMGAFCDSAALHGKLVFLEDDHRPAFSTAANAPFSTRDDWHDEMFFRQTFAQMLSHGQQIWWYSLGAGWFREESRRGVVGGLHRLGLEFLDMDRGSVAEVALVIDERSVSTMRFNPMLQRLLLTDAHGGFFPSGAPFETHELRSFLNDTDHSRFKVVVFLNLFRLDSSLLNAIDKLKADDRTLMFFFAPGYLRDRDGKRTFSVDSVGELIGMRVEDAGENVPLTIWCDPARVSLLSDGRDVRFGWLHMDSGINPTALSVTDANAEPLGYLHGGSVGFAAKRHSNWMSVYSAAPNLPLPVLQAILKRAGVHLYTEAGDVVYANKSALAFVASSNGPKTIKMPYPAILTDAVNGEILETDCDNRVHLDMIRQETRIFRLRIH